MFLSPNNVSFTALRSRPERSGCIAGRLRAVTRRLMRPLVPALAGTIPFLCSPTPGNVSDQAGKPAHVVNREGLVAAPLGAPGRWNEGPCKPKLLRLLEPRCLLPHRAHRAG